MRKILSIILLATAFVCFGQGTITRTPKSNEKSEKSTPKKQEKQPATKHTGSSTPKTSAKKHDSGGDKTEKRPVQPPYSQPSGTANGMGYVDLGLPSGILWATSNIGASTPEDAGDFFSFAYTTPCDIKTGNYDSRSLSSAKEHGYFNMNSQLADGQDVARVNLGKAWSLPDSKDWNELLGKCKWEWTSYNDKYGYKITGPNGNSIFLIAPGFYDKDRKLSGYKKEGRYLTPEYENPEEYEKSAKVISISASEKGAIGENANFGMSARPVIKQPLSNFTSAQLTALPTGTYEQRWEAYNAISEPDGYINNEPYVDLGLPSGRKWAYQNVGGSDPTVGVFTYRWGDVERYHSERKSRTKDKNPAKLISKKIMDNNGHLTPEYDAATAIMGSGWRIPTADEFEELIKYCEWTGFNYTSKNHTYYKSDKKVTQKGWKVKGPNGHSIFIPEGHIGSKFGRSSWDNTYYWTSTPVGDNAAREMKMTNWSVDCKGTRGRAEGLPIRAVVK